MQKAVIDMKHSPRRILAAMIILILIIMAVVLIIRNSKVDDGMLSVSGVIEATETDIASRIPGRIAKLTVDEGDRVKKGQIIAVLDVPEMDARVGQAEGVKSSTEARYADIMRGTRIETIRQARANYDMALASSRGSKDVYSTITEAHTKSTELEANYETAKANFQAAKQDMDFAAANLQLVTKGPRQEQLDALDSIVSRAKAVSTKSEKDYRRISQLYESGAVSAQQNDAALAARDADRSALDAATARYNEALSGARPEEVDQAKARYAQSQARLSGARSVLDASKEAYTDRLESLVKLENSRTAADTSRQQVKVAKAQLDLALAGATAEEKAALKGQVQQSASALKEAQSQLSQSVVVAETDGFVTVKYHEVGEVVTPGSAIMRIANLDNVWLRVYIPLPKLGAVKVGGIARIVTDSYADEKKTFIGTIASINDEAEFTPRSIQTKEERIKLVYAVRIKVANEEHLLKPGMPADALIAIK